MPSDRPAIFPADSMPHPDRPWALKFCDTTGQKPLLKSEVAAFFVKETPVANPDMGSKADLHGPPPSIPLTDAFREATANIELDEDQPVRWFACSDEIAEELRKLGVDMSLRIYDVP